MTAENRVPRTVARGIVLVGSFTSSAGMVADSSPRNAHKVNAPVAVMAENEDSSLVLKGVKLSILKYSKPSVEMTASGTILSMVVTSCTNPALRTPIVLIHVRSQILARATIPAKNELDASAGQKNAK